MVSIHDIIPLAPYDHTGNVSSDADDYNPSRAARGARLVMDAAVRALVHNGCARLSVRRVVAKARVSIVAVKHHFASKDGLLAATEHVTTRFRSHADELAQSALAEERPAVASLVSVYLANVGETPDAHAEAG